MAILPFVEQGELYQKFHLNEAWNSTHNRTLVSKMPATFANPGEGPKAPFKTYYRGFVGPNAFFSGQGGRKVPEGFPGGTSATLAIFEAKDGVIWTAPEELPYATDKPLPKFGDWFDNGFNGTLCDGSVRLFSHKIDEATIRSIINIKADKALVAPVVHGPSRSGEVYNGEKNGRGRLPRSRAWDYITSGFALGRW